METKVLNILVVDDDHAIRKMMEFFFKHKGCTITCVADPFEGLEVLKKGKFDAAIVDIRIPGMEGPEFIQKGIDLCPSTHFFIFTGMYDFKIPEALKAKGLTKDSIIYKPVIELNNIYDLIVSVIEKKR